MSEIVEIVVTEVLSAVPGHVVVVVPETTTEVVEVAMQGPPGIQGIPGPAGGSTLVKVGATPISGHSAVAYDSAGLLAPADTTNPAHLGAVLGVVADAYMAGADAVVQTGFSLNHVGWSWAPGPVFVGVGGVLTQALPPFPVFTQVIGYALSATRILIDPQPPFIPA